MVASWNVSSVTTNKLDVSHGASAFHLSISNWDVSDVTQKGETIRAGHHPINHDILNVTKNYTMPLPSIMIFPNWNAIQSDRHEWDVPRYRNSQLTEMHRLFHGTLGFNHCLSYWDVSNVTHMREMPTGASSLNQNVYLS
jgi:hypothetical protein